MSSRPSAMTAAGFVLSQATRQTRPSKRWPRATSWIESAITSRETSDARIPSVPIDTPSETATVLNSIGVPPASRMPRRTCRASSRWFQLHGMVSIHDVAMPTSGRASASSSRPIPFNIARAAARSTPSVSAALLRFAGSVGRAYGSASVDAMRPHIGGRRSVQAHGSRQGPQLDADALDVLRAPLALLAQLCESRPSCLVVSEQLLRERTAADLLEDPAHPLAHAVVYDACPARKVAVLGDVRDRVPHVLVAALVEQVDDQLQLVEALVVGDLRLVARFDERVEAGLHERGNAAAQHGLLPEEVALGLLGERRLEQADAAAADADAVRKRERERPSA